MPILELTHLRIPPTPSTSTNTSAPSKSAITITLQQVRALLAEKVHATNSRFYTPIQQKTPIPHPHPSPLSPSPTTTRPKKTGEDGAKHEEEESLDVYILGSWPSLYAHSDFLQNPVLRTSILGPQEGVLEFIRGEHYELTHTHTLTHQNVPFNSSNSQPPIKENLMIHLPLTAPILVITRIEVPPRKRGEEKSPGLMTLDSHRMNLQKRGGGYASLILLDDADATSKKRCYIILSGWESISSYTSWREDSGVDSEGCVEVLILEDLERGD